MKKIKLVEIEKLKCHEGVDLEHVRELEEKIRKENKFTTAIFVDEKSGVILDGHHRYHVACSLHLRRIPCVCLDYLNDQTLTVQQRRNIQVSKDRVIEFALSNRRFPYKTTRHVLNGIPTSEIKVKVNVPLSDLC